MNEQLIIDWVEERGLLQQSNPHAQLSKMVEELGEVAECINKGYKETLKLEIGDLLVTIIILAKMYDYTAAECLLSAYEKIKHRKGEMVNGVFVKEDDDESR